MMPIPNTDSTFSACGPCAYSKRYGTVRNVITVVRCIIRVTDHEDSGHKHLSGQTASGSATRSLNRTDAMRKILSK